MKKLLSLFAAAIVCAVMFTSCGSEFQDDLSKGADAINKGDYATASQVADKIYAGKDKAVAFEMVAAFIYKAGAGADIINNGGENYDINKAIEIYTKATEILNYAKTMKGFNEAAAEFPNFASAENDVKKTLDGLKVRLSQVEAENDYDDDDDDDEE